VVPSLFEPFGIVALEAMAAKEAKDKPVIEAPPKSSPAIVILAGNQRLELDNTYRLDFQNGSWSVSRR
jgi:hypothetical protein